MPTGYNAESYVSLKMCRSSVNFKEGYGYLNIIDQNTFKSLKNKPKIVEYGFLIKPYGNQGFVFLVKLKFQNFKNIFYSNTQVIESQWRQSVNSAHHVATRKTKTLKSLSLPKATTATC